MVASIVTFTSCKSYDEDIDLANQDIKTSQTEITNLKASIEALTKQMTDLNNATKAALDAQIETLKTEVTSNKTLLATLQTELASLKAHSATKTQITELQNQIDNLKTTIVSQATSIAALEAFQVKANADIAALQTEMAVLKAQLETKANREDLTALEAQITALELDLQAQIDTKASGADLTAAEARLIAQIAALKLELETKISALQLDLEAQITALQLDVDSKIIALSTTLNLLGVKVDTIDGNLTALSNTVTTLDGKLTTLITTVSNLEGDFTDLSGTVTNLRTDLQTLDGKVGTTISDLATLTGRVDAQILLFQALKLVVDGNVGDISDIKGDLITQLGKITANQDSITALRTALNAQGDSILALQVANNTNVANIAANANAIILNATAISTNKDSIMANASAIQANILRINGNAAAISLNADSIEANALRITALETEVTALTNKFNSLATAMSLNFDALSSRLTSLTFIPTLFVHGIEAMNFSPLLSECTTITPLVVVSYHMNPSFIKASDIDIDNLTFAITESKNIMLAKGSKKAPAATVVSAQFISADNGILKVGVKVEDFNAAFGNNSTNVTGGTYPNPVITETFNMIALQVPLAEKVLEESKVDVNGDIVTVAGEDGVVTSQYVRLYNQTLTAQTDVWLAKNVATYPKLSQTLNGAKAQTVKDIDGATTTDPLVIPLANGGTINLVDSVIAMQGLDTFAITKYGLKFRFDLLDEAGNVIEYNRVPAGIDQQGLIDLTNAAKGTIKAKAVTQQVIADSKGRTPIVRVTMYNEQDPTCPVLFAFVKVHLLEKSISTTWKDAKSPATCEDRVLSVGTPFMTDSIYGKAGMSKADFQANYTSVNFSSTGDGVINYNTVGTDGVLSWGLTAIQIWTKLVASTTLEASFTATATYKSTQPAVYPNFTVVFTKTFTKEDVYNIARAQLISNYWYADYTYVKHNINVPAVGQTDGSSALFTNNINQAFEQNANKSLKGLTNYKYSFLKDQPIHVDGTTNGTKLKVNFDGTQLLLASDTADVVATINPFATNVGDVLILNQASITAKRLLNFGPEFLTARVAISSLYCVDYPQFVRPVTVDGKKYFDVKFVRPINAIPNPGAYFIDGKNFGEENTYLEVADLVNLADWRNGTDYVSTFAAYPNYYQYYGVDSIIAHVDQIRTNLNQTAPNKVLISNYPNLLVKNAVVVAGVTPPANNFGYLTYQNMGNTLGVAFNLYVPVTIKYAWGQIVTTEIIVEVQKTVGPSGVKPRK